MARFAPPNMRGLLRGSGIPIFSSWSTTSATLACSSAPSSAPLSESFTWNLHQYPTDQLTSHKREPKESLNEEKKSASLCAKSIDIIKMNAK